MRQVPLPELQIRCWMKDKRGREGNHLVLKRNVSQRQMQKM